MLMRSSAEPEYIGNNLTEKIGYADILRSDILIPQKIWYADIPRSDILVPKSYILTRRSGTKFWWVYYLFSFFTYTLVASTMVRGSQAWRCIHRLQTLSHVHELGLNSQQPCWCETTKSLFFSGMLYSLGHRATYSIYLMAITLGFFISPTLRYHMVWSVQKALTHWM